MNIYHISIRQAYQDLDSYSAFIVAAGSASAARKQIKECGDECRHDNNEVCLWRNPARSTCRRIGVAAKSVKPGVIASSFHAG